MKTLNSRIKDYRIIYIIMCLLIPTAASYINPVLSIYLTEQLNFSSAMVSAFFVLMPLFMVFTVQLCGRISDSGFDRRTIILCSCVFGVLSNLLLSSKPSATAVFTLAIPLYALSQVAYSQIFASAREYSVKHMTSSLGFTTFLRSLASVSWVAGPPIAYYLIVNISFNALFYLCLGIFIIAGAVNITALPDLRDHQSMNRTVKKNDLIISKNIVILFLSTVMMFTAFSSYLTTMPLYLTHELEESRDLPGYIFSISAFLEIPIMFWCIRFARKTGLKKVIATGALSLALFLFILPHVHSGILVLWLSILPAVFIGTVSSMGMIYFQELLPSIPGQATSLFLNGCTCGQIIGGALICISSNGHYSSIYYTSAFIAAAALALFIRVKKPQQIR